ncbi:MAG: hypothetical protein Q4G39_08945 [Brachymonas sp.]|nr:hypothetical protein [Brachymonas sp.]
MVLIKKTGLVAALSVLALAGCGGGGGGTPSATATPGGGAPAVPAPSPQTPAPQPVVDPCSAQGIAYQVADGTTTLQKANETGALGYAFATDIARGMKTYGIFVSNESGTYAYRATAPAQDVAGWKTALNANGQEGYLFKGPLVLNNQMQDLYVKNTKCNRTYTYEVEALGISKDAALAQMNAWGQKGYNTLQPYFVGASPATVAVFFKDSASADKFSHDLVPSTIGIAATQTLLSERGAQGWSYLGPVVFEGVSYFWFMKRDSVSTVEYQVVDTEAPANDTAAAVADVFNSHAKQGFYYFGSQHLGTQSADIYYKSTKMVQQPLSGISNP